MKRIIVALMCALMLVSLVGCSNAGAPEGMQNAASENEAFYLFVPQAWTPNTSSGIASAYYSASVDRSNVSVTCTLPAEGYLSVEQYVTYTTDSLGKLLGDFTVVSAPAEAKLGGAAALSFDYTATVNGVAYDVTVDETGAAPAPVAAAPAAAPAPAAKPAAAGPVNGTKVNAPMPGMIKSLSLPEGSAVKEGDVILVLEAMKMDNDITAPCDGVISFKAQVGSNVNTGDVMAVIG